MADDLFQIQAERARHSLVDFAIHTNPKYEPSFHHEIIANALEEVANGKIDRLIITCPPRSGKSELCTVLFPAWYLGKFPSRQLITASYSGDLAAGFGRKVRNLFDTSVYKSVFPGSGLAADSQAAATWHTLAGGGYIAAGVGGSLTGFGAHCAIIDDPVKDREQADSQMIRDKVYEWYQSVLYTRLEEKGAIILIMTRWNKDDLVGRLLADNRDKWHVINLPAIAEEDEKFRKKGEALWAKKYSLQDLERIKENIGAHDFASLYQQQPIDRASREFQEDWLQYFEKEPPGLTYFLAVDPAISKKDTACNSAVVVCGVDANSNIFVVDYVAAKLNPGELIDSIMDLASIWNPLKVGVENIAYQAAVSYYLQRAMEEKKMFLDIVELRHTGDKIARIRRLVPYFRSRKVFLKRDQKALIQEISEFPSGALVDIIDALSMVLEIMSLPDVVLESEKPHPYANDPDSPWGRQKGSFNGYMSLYQ